MPATRPEQLVWSPEAEGDLEEIWHHACTSVEPLAADRYIRRIDDLCRSLVAFPLRGRSREDLRPGLRSISCPPHLIFYRLRSTAVEIVRVLHARRDVGPLLATDA